MSRIRVSNTSVVVVAMASALAAASVGSLFASTSLVKPVELPAAWGIGVSEDLLDLLHAAAEGDAGEGAALHALAEGDGGEGAALHALAEGDGGEGTALHALAEGDGGEGAALHALAEGDSGEGSAT
jgi:hypothetical protein